MYAGTAVCMQVHNASINPTTHTRSRTKGKEVGRKGERVGGWKGEREGGREERRKGTGMADGQVK